MDRLRKLLIIAALPSFAQKGVDFNRDVRPILSDNCFSCHGPDEKGRMANLRLDTKEGLLSRVTAGKSKESPLFARVTHANKAMRMPPAATGRVLTEKQIEAVRGWIDQGAKWETHWSYSAPVRPDVPKPKSGKWVRNDIDRFVLVRLDREGLRPSPEADKATLLRRVTFDLTGLPPTAAEVQSFVGDKSPKAYDKVVERLLANERYGEKMALHWMDLARYADSHGYHIDPHRDMWPWRDWVIRTFNANKPFDQFTVEQLAGDLLPGATREQKLATGFNRNHMINFEGGAIPEEYQTEYVIDRLEATANVFMGMTMGCARCHDHKYDPISQRDFYRFFAFFNTIPEKGLDGTTGNAAPFLFLGKAAELAEMEKLREEIKAAKKVMDEKAAAAAQAEWEKSHQPPALVTRGIVAHYEFDGSLADASGRYQYGRAVEPNFGGGIIGKSISFGPDDAAVLGSQVRIGPASALTVWIRPTHDKPVPILQGGGIRIYSSEVDYVPDRKLGSTIDIVHAGKHYRTRKLVINSRWSHLAFMRGKLFVDGAEVPLAEIGDGESASETALEIRGFRGSIDDLRVYDRALTPADITTLAIEAPIASILEIPASKRGKEEKDRLREYFLARTAPDALRQQAAHLKALESRLFDLEHAVPSTMVMEEMEKPRETFLLGRGDYRNKTEKVTPEVPAALPPMPKDAPRNRLGLARWLTSPDHPLLARVTVNRFWQNYFGIGLVKTSEDFGSQGEQPAHRELLDWLATEFIRTGWDVKAMQRLIVTSATYRQSSRVPAELRERDPENRLLARMSRFRLPAELVRDNALAVSGLLHPKIGGPSVLPYQPGGLWEEMAFGREFSMQTYRQDHGPALYRRSMYTFWKRTVPPAQMSTFDAPDREKCTSRRPITNTPLQALILMNDPTYVEASRKLAERIIREGGSDPAKRIAWAYQQALARKPDPREVSVLAEAASRQLSTYRGDREKALRLLANGEAPRDPSLDPGELAAWTNVATMILNLDETITKE